MSAPVYLYGAGGHARVVLAVLDALGRPVGGLFDDGRSGGTLDGYPVLGAFRPEAMAPGGSLVLAIGSNTARQRLAHALDGQVRWADALVHPSVVAHRTVQLGAGTVVFAGAILQPGTVVGRHAIVNTAATVDHDGRIGDFAHLAPGVHLAGNVQVEEGAFLGIASSAVPGRHIGAWSTVGAGGVVVHDVPAGVTVVGIPARVVAPRQDAR